MGHSENDNLGDEGPNTFRRMGDELIGRQERPGTCETHGTYSQQGYVLGARTIWTGCPTCGAARQEAEELERRKSDAEAKQRRLEAQLRQTGVPLRYRGKSFQDFDIADADAAMADAKEHARVVTMEFANNFTEHYRRGSTLILSGDKGTGKTHLACAIAQAIMHDATAMYVTAMDAIRMVRDTWKGPKGGMTESDVLDKLATVDLLILDEIGNQYGTDGEKVVLFDVLDKRYRDLMPTIVLTNLDKAELNAVLGDRSFDRLRECGQWVPFPWSSARPPANRRRVTD